MENIPIMSFYVVVHHDTRADGDGIDVPVTLLQVVDLEGETEKMEVLPVYILREDAEESYLMKETASNLPEDREATMSVMPPWQLKDHLEDNPNIDAVVLVYLERDLPVRRSEFIRFLEELELPPDVDDVLGLSA